MVPINKCGFLIAALLSAMIMMSCGSSGNLTEPKPNSKNETIDWSTAANTSTNALINNFWNSSSNYWNKSTTKKAFTYWTGAHATDVVIAAYIRTDNPNYVNYIDNWYAGIQQQMNNTFVNDYYDDMEWNALALLRAYNATGEQKFKRSLDNLWINIKGGWSDSMGGGIIWHKTEPNGKNAISNAPASILASKLYNLSGNEKDLKWAKKIYAWEKNTLVDSTNGAVWDNIKRQADGTTNIQKDWVFTYNQGVYLGAGLKLYQITGEQHYLDDAVQAADYTLNALTNKKDNVLKDEGNGDGGLFKGIFVRFFTQLILEQDLSDTSRTRYINFLTHNAKTLWEEGRTDNGLYSSYWKKKPVPNDEVDQSTETSGSILIESMALLSEKGMLDKQ